MSTYQDTTGAGTVLTRSPRLTALGLAPLLLSLQGTVDGLLTALGL